MNLVLGFINHGSLCLAVFIIKWGHNKEGKSCFCWELSKLQFLILAVVKQQHVLLQSKHFFVSFTFTDFYLYFWEGVKVSLA